MINVGSQFDMSIRALGNSKESLGLAAPERDSQKSDFKSKLNNIKDNQNTPSRSKQSDAGEEKIKKTVPTSGLETKPVESDLPVQKVNKVDKAENVVINSENLELSKQAAIAAFLDKMQKELGVSPEQVLQAFSKLNADSLMVAPEISADQFIEALNLSDDLEPRAHELYAEMLTWTAAAQLSQNLIAQNQNANFEVLNPEEAMKREQIEGLNKLSNNFFMNGPKSEKPQAEKGLPLAQSQIVPNRSAENVITSADPQKASSTTTTNRESSMAASENAMPVPDSMTNVQPQPFDISPDAENFMLQPATVNQIPTAEMPEFTMTKLSGPNGSSTNVFSSPAEMVRQAAMKAYSGDTSADTGSGEGQKSEMTSDLSVLSEPQAKKVDAEFKSFVIQAPAPSESEMQSNLKDIINGAQTMVKNGGGEMKMKLQPEGLGELNLKVVVQNGEVKVEMITNSDEARKLLEKGLADLKHSLASQKLNVESIKVESASSSQQMNLENQQQQAGDRNFQQRFLQDFRNSNERMRNGIIGISSARKPSSQIMDDAANAIMQPKKNKNAARRLDLVA